MRTTFFSLLLAALTVAGFGESLSAQTADADLTITRVIDASADEVWAQIRDLDALAKHSTIIAKVDFQGPEAAGGQRTCTTPDGQGKFVESILEFSDANRSYRYAVVEGTPAKNLVNAFKVVDLGYNRCMIVWTSEYEAFMQNPQMTEDQFRGFMTNSLNEILDSYTAAAKA